MNSFYEKFREEQTSLAVLKNGKHTFPAHFHQNLEIFLLREGKYTLYINDKRQEAEGGSVVVIDSYDVHSYGAPQTDERNDCVILIPFKFLRSFQAKRKNMQLVEHVLRNKELCDSLFEIAERYFVPTISESVLEAAVDLFLSVLYEHLEFCERKEKDESVLVRNILTFIHENYQKDVSRKAIAKALGYTEAHISRVFHRYLQTSVSNYVNKLRLEYIDRQRRAGDDRTTLDLLYEAGFKSQQTYYRQRQHQRQRTANVPLDLVLSIFQE